jgi:[ribosomal protein S5]-alanine N-acetyltransferase
VRVRGPTLTLRYPRPDDAPALFELARDPEVVRFFSWGPYERESEALAFVESLERKREAGDRLELAIAGEDDRLLGITGLSELSRRDRRAVLGTWLGRPHWGSGANRESKTLVLALAFRTLGLLRVTALAHPENARSLAALERLGFTREGVLRSWHVHRGEPRDVAILRLLREEFERGPLADLPVEIEGEPPAAWVTGGRS